MTIFLGGTELIQSLQLGMEGVCLHYLSFSWRYGGSGNYCPFMQTSWSHCLFNLPFESKQKAALAIVNLV